MPKATVRASATALPKSSPERLRGLKIVAQALDEAKKDAPTLEEKSYARLVAEKCAADARLEIADEQRKAEAEAEAEKPKLESSRNFANTYHRWLHAKAALEDPSAPDEETAELQAIWAAAELSLFSTRAAYPDQLWQKLEAFEAVLGDELVSGTRRDSILLLALGSIKQDIINLDLLEASR